MTANSRRVALIALLAAFVQAAAAVEMTVPRVGLRPGLGAGLVIAPAVRSGPALQSLAPMFPGMSAALPAAVVPAASVSVAAAAPEAVRPQGAAALEVLRT
ncbi:MAG: hypothetical protein AAB262_07270, partial [Elusimicrobiota bacterium]